MKKLIYLIFMIPCLAAADQKVSNMVNDLTPANTDFMYIVANSTSMKVGVANLLNVGSTNYVSATAGMTYSSASVSYLGISSTPWSLTDLTYSSAAVSYLGISSTPWTTQNYITSTTANQTLLNLSSYSFVTSGTNPTVTAQGQVGLDTTANQLLSSDGANTFVVGQATRAWTVSISSGIGFYGSTMAVACASPNAGFTITDIRATSLPASTTVQYSLDYRSYGSEGNIGTSVITLSTANATGLETTTFSNSAIPSGGCLYLILPSTDVTVGNPYNLKVNVNGVITRQ